MTIMIPDSVKVKQVQGKWILLDCCRNEYYAINESGANLLQRLQKYGCLTKAIEEISQYFNVSLERVQEDALSFLDQLQKTGVIMIQ